MCDLLNLLLGPDFAPRVAELKAQLLSFEQPHRTAMFYLLIPVLNNLDRALLLSVLNAISAKKLQVLRQQANDLDFVTQQLKQDDDCLSLLECYLPLLSTNSTAALRSVYNNAIRNAVRRCPEKCRQLLAYAVMQPALSGDDFRNEITLVASIKQRQFSSETNPPKVANEKLCAKEPVWSVRAPMTETSPANHVNLASYKDLKNASSTSELPMFFTNNSKNTFTEFGSGMKDVPKWLKFLRLHKYNPLFSRLTYDEMMVLTEKALENEGVTRGARNKILLNIQRLKDRPKILAGLLASIKAGDRSLREVIDELFLLSISPIKSPIVSKEDTRLTELLMDVISAVSSAMLSRNDCLENDENCGNSLYDEKLMDSKSKLVGVIDKFTQHEAFSKEQKENFCRIRKEICKSVPNLAPMLRTTPSKNKKPGFQKFSHEMLHSKAGKTQCSILNPFAKPFPVSMPSCRVPSHFERHSLEFPTRNSTSLVTLHRSRSNNAFPFHESSFGTMKTLGENSQTVHDFNNSIDDRNCDDGVFIDVNSNFIEKLLDG